VSNPKTLGGAWQPGQSGNPAGRAIGSRSKLTEKFLTALHEDFLAHGAVAIAQAREKYPVQYLRIIVRIIPRELHVRNESMFAGLSNDDVDNLLVEVRRQLAARAGISGGEGSDTPPGNGQLN
jgi:hypothetical protein